MSLKELFDSGRFALSIEMFPPKTAQGDASVLRSLEDLSRFGPEFISCTYGAGGSTQDRTIMWCETIQKKLKIPAMAHFTCVGSNREQLEEWLDRAVGSGVQNIMALRGDPPQGQDGFKVVEGGLRYANELVELIRSRYPDLGIGVAGYPEKHAEAPSMDQDLCNLQRKVDSGADAIFTQLFFQNECFLNFRDRCDQMGIQIPLIPGIMPITDYARIKRITAMCGTAVPEDLAAQLEAAQEDTDKQFRIGVDFAIRQCEELIRNGVPGIHFYALNRSAACEQILASLDLPSHES